MSNADLTENNIDDLNDDHFLDDFLAVANEKLDLNSEEPNLSEEENISTSVNNVPSKNLSLQKAQLTVNARKDYEATCNKLFSKQNVQQSKPVDVFIDPIFRLRIVNPLISADVIKEKMIGRAAVQFSELSRFINMKAKDTDWVIAGVVANKSAVKTSQKGSQFSIWTLTDLKGDIKTATLFLFSNAHKEFSKTSTGTVVGVLNPNIMDKKDGSKDEASLSIDNPQKIMIFGQSKDLGTCKSIKKNGDRCHAIVNNAVCEYCIFHMKQEYQKCSKRSHFQGANVDLRNKVLGKNEVFYAGKSYTAIKAKKSSKLVKRDNALLQNLNGVSVLSNNITKAKNTGKSKMANNLEINQSQRLKDLTLLNKLGADLSSLKSMVNITQTTNTQSTDSKVAPKKDPTVMNIPVLSGLQGTMIDLDQPVSFRHKDRAKRNAINYIQRHGPIKKIDPNSIKKSKENYKKPLETKAVEETIKKLENASYISDRFKKMMAQTSKHADLLEQKDDEEQEKYFDKLEVKERMEEKMINTFKVPCKAVTCTVCKYTSFSAAERCKEEKHPLKVTDGMKRFFKCGQCGNRTVSLNIVPTKKCTNCGSGKWEKTGMMKEKIVRSSHSLSIRGGEQKFINSDVQDQNLSLLMPDE